MVQQRLNSQRARKSDLMRQPAARLLQQYHRYISRLTSTVPIATRKACTAASAASSASCSSREGLLLDASIGPGLQLLEQQFDVCGHRLRMIAPADVDAVMDMYISSGTDGDPYWCRVWPSAISLAQHLLQRPHLVRGKTVADLGAGLGVAGIAAALAGAAEVVLLDREVLALHCGLVSAAASGVQSVQGLEDVKLQGWQQQGFSGVDHCGSSSSSGGVEGVAAAGGALQLAEIYLQHRYQQQQQQRQESLGQATNGRSDGNGVLRPLQLPQQQHGSSSAGGGVFRAQAFDWSSTEVPERYDVVLACDVLYEDSAVEPVASVMSRLLKPKPGSMLLLADPPNRTAANRERFAELLSTQNSTGVTLLLAESEVYECDVNQLDPEMVGGVTTQIVPVQFMAFRAAIGHDTIGLKA